ncbi:hypothetical protein LP420_09745 [Massilia sp. B-10]|nr:hypothetical protein LP420_09745 [Massilia sp. B-10]
MTDAVKQVLRKVAPRGAPPAPARAAVAVPVPAPAPAAMGWQFSVAVPSPVRQARSGRHSRRGTRQL